MYMAFYYNNTSCATPLAAGSSEPEPQGRYLYSIKDACGGPLICESFEDAEQAIAQMITTKSNVNKGYIFNLEAEVSVPAKPIEVTTTRIPNKKESADA